MAILAPTERQSGWLHETARRIMHAAGVPLNGARESASRLQLRSGARLLALPATEASVRGLADVDLLVFDEAARTPFSLYAACLPMLAASAGAVVALSTPNGKRGWFADAWFGEDGDDWHREEVPWTECPHLDRETIEKQRRKLGNDLWSQEFCCTFHDADRAAFSGDDIEAAQDGTHDAWSAFKPWLES